MIAYPKADLPNTIQFLPTGGPSGGPAFKLDAAGSDPTILAIRKPLAKLSDWSTSVEYLVDTSAMSVTDNGYEGVGIRSRLLKEGTNAPYSIYDSGLLNGTSADWHTRQDTWHTITQRLDYGVSEQPEAEDIQFVVKAPLGSYAKLAQLSVINQYSRFYEAEVTGEASSLVMNRVTDLEYFYSSVYGTVVARSLSRTQWLYYLDTIPVNIGIGESIQLTFSGVLSLISSFELDVPMTLTASVKFTAANGSELWKTIASFDSSSEEIPDTLIEGSNNFTAQEEYIQAELVLVVTTLFGIDSSKILGHKGMDFSLTTSRSIVSTNV